MGVLAEYVRKEANQLREEFQSHEAAVQEWKEAVERLYCKLEQMVQVADAGHALLGFTRSPRPTFQEPRLGVYELECLQISIGGSAEVRPRARHVIATIRPQGQEQRRADGMVEIRGSAGAEYYLFRLKGADGDRWYVQSVARWNSDREYGTVDELDQDRFEAAVLTVLQ